VRVGRQVGVEGGLHDASGGAPELLGESHQHPEVELRLDAILVDASAGFCGVISEGQLFRFDYLSLVALSVLTWVELVIFVGWALLLVGRLQILAAVVRGEVVGRGPEGLDLRRRVVRHLLQITREVGGFRVP